MSWADRMAFSPRTRVNAMGEFESDDGLDSYLATAASAHFAKPRRTQARKPPDMTERRAETVRMWSQGATMRQIAEALGTTIGAVRGELKRNRALYPRRRDNTGAGGAL